MVSVSDKVSIISKNERQDIVGALMRAIQELDERIKEENLDENTNENTQYG